MEICKAEGLQKTVLTPVNNETEASVRYNYRLKNKTKKKHMDDKLKMDLEAFTYKLAFFALNSSEMSSHNANLASLTGKSLNFLMCCRFLSRRVCQS